MGTWGAGSTGKVKEQAAWARKAETSGVTCFHGAASVLDTPLQAQPVPWARLWLGLHTPDGRHPDPSMCRALCSAPAPVPLP